MIDRGIRLPSSSLRWPDSILWLISVLIVIASPADADLGTLTRGVAPDAMFFSLNASAAAAADCDFDRARGLGECAIGHLGHYLCHLVVGLNARMAATALDAYKIGICTPVDPVPS